MPSQTLKPCPFCKSGDVELVTSLTERAGKWNWWDAHISCHSCRARTGTFEGETKSEAVAYAVAAWNRRAGEETQSEANRRADRLADIVRRMADVTHSLLGNYEYRFRDDSNSMEWVKNVRELIREARAAIGEDSK